MKFGIPVRDEINPHFIYQLNRNTGKLSNKKLELYGEEESDLPQIFVEENQRKKMVRQIRDEFIDLYDKAVAFLEGHKYGPRLLEAVQRSVASKKLTTKFYPLAYRVDLETEDMAHDNPYTMSKLGGMPHPLLIKNGKYAVERAWPWCPNCLKPMLFLGQLDLTCHQWVIHQLTMYPDPKKEFPYPVSGLGWDQDKDLPHSGRLHQYFYCPCGNFDSPNCDAAVIEQYVFKDEEKIAPEAEKQIRDFMEKHKLLEDNDEDGMGGHISPQRVMTMTVGMDLDTPNEGWRGMKRFTSGLWDLQSKFGDEFKSNGAFTLWGAPASQQTEKRFHSSHYMFNLRMAPVINWCDENHDITRQMYGCYRTYRGPGKMYCRMDNSNT